jgi:hypothetical protein
MAPIAVRDWRGKKLRLNRTRSVMSHPADTFSVVAETVRAACVNVARLAYEDAGIRGLCPDGRWEAALTAIRQLDLSGVLDLQPDQPVSTETPEC